MQADLLKPQPFPAVLDGSRDVFILPKSEPILEEVLFLKEQAKDKIVVGFFFFSI